jgi:hypothetical protein
MEDTTLMWIYKVLHRIERGLPLSKQDIRILEEVGEKCSLR